MTMDRAGGRPDRRRAVWLGSAVVLVALLTALATVSSVADDGVLRVLVAPPGTPAKVQYCTSFSWSDANDANESLAGNCAGSFAVNKPVVNASTGWGWAAFIIAPVAEVTPVGSIVALAYPGMGWVTNTTTADEVNITDTIVMNVTNAIGLNGTTNLPNGLIPQWIPSDVPDNLGPTIWAPGQLLLGNATVGITFHFLTTGANASQRIKFDVTVSGWPWVSPTDVLGVEVEAVAFHGPTQVHFTYNATSDSVLQVWDSNNTTLSSIAFGPTANATGTAPTTLNVQNDVGFSPGPTPVVAYALLTFNGGGGYSHLAYDPWVLFGAQTALVPPLGGPGPGHHGAGGPLAGVLSPPVFVAIGGAALGGVALGVMARRMRRRPLEEGLAGWA